MPRAPMQVVVIPYRKGADGEPEFAIFQRIDDGKWQPIAGGAEDEESAAMAARREAFEEAGIRPHVAAADDGHRPGDAVQRP